MNRGHVSDVVHLLSNKMCIQGPWLHRGAPAKETGLGSNLYYSCYITQTAIELKNLFLFNCGRYSEKASTFLPSDVSVNYFISGSDIFNHRVQQNELKAAPRAVYVSGVFVLVLPVIVWAGGFSIEQEAILWSLCSCGDWVNPTKQQQPSQPILMNHQREAQKQLRVMLLWHLFFACEEPSNYQSIWEFPGDRSNCQL